MRKFETSDLIGYAVFAALFLAVAVLHPTHAADTKPVAPAADAKSPSRD